MIAPSERTVASCGLLLSCVIRLSDRGFMIPAGRAAFKDEGCFAVALAQFAQLLRIPNWEFVDFR